MYSEQLPSDDGRVPPYQFLPAAVPYVSADITVTPDTIDMEVRARIVFENSCTS